MRQKRTYEELKGVEKEVCDLCRVNQTACDSNTELCIEFWNSEGWNTCYDFFNVIRKYPPESLTKYRRNLIFDGLIHPSEESRKHSIEMEQKNHSQEKEIHDYQAHKRVSNCLFPNQSMQ